MVIEFVSKAVVIICLALLLIGCGPSMLDANRLRIDDESPNFATTISPVLVPPIIVNTPGVSIREASELSNIHLMVERQSILGFGDKTKVFALNKNIAFLYGMPPGFEKTHLCLLRTENGGQSWEEVIEPIPGSEILEMYFIDGGIGWITVMWTIEGAGELLIFQTTDYGKSWNKLSPVRKWRWWGNPTLLMFKDQLHGTLHLDYYYYPDVPDTRVGFLTTADGGRTWEETGWYPLDGEKPSDKSKQLEAYYREYDIHLDLSESMAKDGSVWKVNKYERDAPVFTISRKIYSENIWEVVSKLPVRFKYIDDQARFP